MPVQIGWLEMGWQLRPNEVEEREGEREEETTTTGRQTQRKEKRVRWMTKRNEGGVREGGTRGKERRRNIRDNVSAR